MPKPKIACVVGTRPDAIKTAPVVLALRSTGLADVRLWSTGQHREMLAQALDAFGLRADVDLQLMEPGQTLSRLTARALTGIDGLISEHRPDYLIAQGDTTTTFVASLAAFYNRVPFGHVEAGLRTNDLDNPFPEEFNRKAAAIVTRHHFAPTKWAAENLRDEGYSEGIWVTGNTGIDAVLAVASRVEHSWFPEHAGRVVLLTTHRRENWGEPQEQIARACLRLLGEFPDALLVVPMHKNPLVRDTLQSNLGSHDRVRLIEPPDYAPFAKLLQRADLILTDSGGVQEEAPSFGKPVLVLRVTTERPEGVEAGVAKLVGTDEETVFEAARTAMGSLGAGVPSSPYGDGKASARIASVVLRSLGVEVAEEPMWA